MDNKHYSQTCSCVPCNVSVNSKCGHFPQTTPGDPHVLVALGVVVCSPVLPWCPPTSEFVMKEKFANLNMASFCLACLGKKCTCIVTIASVKCFSYFNKNYTIFIVSNDFCPIFCCFYIKYLAVSLGVTLLLPEGRSFDHSFYLGGIHISKTIPGGVERGGDGHSLNRPIHNLGVSIRRRYVCTRFKASLDVISFPNVIFYIDFY